MNDSELLDAIESATENALAEIAALRAALIGREAEIEQLRTICEERQIVIDALQDAADERVGLIDRLTEEIARLTGDGTDWQAIAVERGTALELVSAEAERRSNLLAELTAALQARTEEVEQLRRERARLS